MPVTEKHKAYKLEWHRRKRREFQEQNGFSTASNYGGLRKRVLERDGYKCLHCGMTDAEHRQKWGRPITLDHKDRNRKHNTMENLQTLCLKCHGKKDLRMKARLPEHREKIMGMVKAGTTYPEIVDATGFTIAAVWKWVKRWAEEDGIQLNHKKGPRPKRKAQP